MKRAIGCVLVLLVAGCGGGGSSGSGADDMGPGSGDGTDACTLTLSGAVTGTYDCTIIATYSAQEGKGGLSIQVANPAPFAQISTSLLEPRELAVGTWTNSDAGAEAAIAAMEPISGSSAPLWDATVDNGAAHGSYTLTLTKVTATISNAGGKSYDLDGTLDATLEPEPMSGASGTITYHATF